MRNRYFEDETIQEGRSKSHIKRVLTYLKPYRWKMLTAFFIIMLSGFSLSMGPYLLKITLDETLPNKDVKQLIFIGIALVGLIIINIFLFKLRISIVTNVGQNVIHKIREDVFVHLQKLPFNYYDERPHGKILVRVVNYINAISELLSQGIIDVLAELMSLIVVLFFMFSIHWRMTLICISITPITFSLVFYVRGKFHKELQILNNKVANMNAYILESISGVKVSQLFVKEEGNIGTLNHLLIENKVQFMRSKKIKFLASPILSISEAIVMIAILLIGSRWIDNNYMTLGILVAFLGYMGQFWSPMSKISDFYAQVADALSYLERIFEVLEEDPEIIDKENPIDMKDIEGRVDFENVSFAYEEDNNILNDFNLRVKAGETVAIVGPTGAGKSTIIHLISRFYDIQKGHIYIDGQSIQDISIQSLRKNMGVMQQDTFIFSDTVKENIRYGKLDATDQEIIEAAKAVCAHDFIIKMENAYETQVHENGSRLSVGQRQLIGLARVFLANPKIIILDEATASIDTETERQIQQGLEALFKGRTTFVIAHRLSTIRHADRIIYLDRGQIVESGNHESLINEKKHYWKLYATQVKYMV